MAGAARRHGRVLRTRLPPRRGGGAPAQPRSRRVRPDGSDRLMMQRTDPSHVERCRAWQRTLYDGGWAGIAWPKEYGGRGASPIEQVLFTEEMARAGAPQLPGVLGLLLVGPTL